MPVFTHNTLYKEYGFRLIEKIQNSIHHETPISYKQGLAGIGSTIEYLVQHGYIDADTDEILEDFDDRIFSVQNLFRLSMEEIKSKGYYANWRMSGNSAKKEMIRQTILPEIEKIMHEKSMIYAWHKSLYTNNSLYLKTATYKHWWEYLSAKPNLSVSPLEGKHTMGNFVLSEHTGSPLHLGIHNGLTGLGLALLTELDGDASWISLFPDET